MSKEDWDKPVLSAEQFEHLWKEHVHNAIFNVQRDVRNIHIMLETLVEAGKLFPSDKITILSRDIEIVLAHLDRSIKDVSNCHSMVQHKIDWIESKEKEEGE